MTAQKLYQERQESIKKQIELIEQLLARHTAKAAQDPKNYGYAGTLGFVGENLNNIIETLEYTN